MNDQSQSGPQADCFCRGAGPRFTTKARACQAQCSIEHFRTAGIEILKGIRNLVDLGIDRLAQEPQARGTTVNVE
jgi:hypothetical protein